MKIKRKRIIQAGSLSTVRKMHCIYKARSSPEYLFLSH